MRSETTDTASANMRAIIIASNILGAADGFRPNARIEPYAIMPMTADGPRIVEIINIITSIVRILSAQLLLHLPQFIFQTTVDHKRP